MGGSWPLAEHVSGRDWVQDRHLWPALALTRIWDSVFEVAEHEYVPSS